MPRAVNPILADINEASNYNFQQVPNRSKRAAGGTNGEIICGGWAQRLMRRCNIETVMYMIEPWERLLVHAVWVLFVAAALHFTFGNSINWLSFFE